MRIAVRWLAIGALPALVSACFSSSNNPPGPDSGEGSDAPGGDDAVSPPGSDGASPEAAPVADAAHEGAAPPADATTDSPIDGASQDDASAEASGPVEASVPGVTVVVRSALGLEQGVNVVFEDGYGQVLVTTYTDANGRLFQPVPPGSQVTVVMGTPAKPQLETIQAIAPGDVLEFYDGSFDGAANPQVAVTLNPDANPPAGTAGVNGRIGDCSVQIPGSVYLQPRCLNAAGQFPLLAVATGGADAGYLDLGYAFMKDIPLAPDDAGVTNVVLSGPWYTDIGSDTIGLMNVPPATSYEDLWNGEMVDGLSMTINNYSTSSYYTTPTSQGATYPAFFDDLVAEANVSTSYNYGTSGNTYRLAVSGIATRGLGDAGTTTFDMSAALPFINDVAVDTTIPAQPIISWGTANGSLSSAKGVVVQITWTDQSVSGSWVFVAPGTVTSITAPAVSNLVATWVPTATAQVATPTMMAVDATFLPSYDALRAQPGVLQLPPQLLGGGSGTPEAPPLPVDGTLRYTAATFNGD
jgi:hypothetical protein